MNCIIIDDEPLARKELQSLIEEVSDVEVLANFSNAIQAGSFLIENQVDLIFLDIEMPTINGLEFAQQIPDSSLLVFTTAYPQYALKSYDLDALGYLLKPIDKSRLEKTLDKAKTYKNLLDNFLENENLIDSNSDEFLLIKSERRFHKVNFSDILFIVGLKDYVVIHTKNQKLITAMNLKTIHQKLPKSIFLRVSKSYLVNIQFIDSFDNHTLYIGETEIPLGEVYKKDFLTQYLDGSSNLD